MAARVPLSDAVKLARKWKKEVDLAGKREKDWRSDADKILKRYKGFKRRAKSFNILWANTEILRPALFNSAPNPDVRRRFRDSDPLGKAISEVLERGLSVIVDQDGTDDAVKNDVLDSLLQGRGLSRIRYVPSITSMSAGDETTQPTEDDGPAASTSPASDDTIRGATQKAYGTKPPASTNAAILGDDNDDATDGAELDEELEYEQADIDHVDWQDFRMGYARTWREVPWVGFRCKLTADEAEQKFGKDPIATIKFVDTAVDSDDDRDRVDAQSEVEKTAQFWEIWDKTSKRVFFTCDSARSLLYTLECPEGEAPLKFTEFFPCPKPLRMFEDSTSMVPTPIFSLYEEQANELDALSFRIDKITRALKVRGMYDATLVELKGLMDAADNDLIPITKAQAWMVNGGLEKAISWMPIETAAAVLKILMDAREQCKQIIYELTGISDILRGASDPNETLGAQSIKAGYGGMRLQRMQREVQRYVRDLLRLCSEVISSKFEQKTLADMTGLQFPTDQQKQQAVAQQQAAAQQAMMPPAGPQTVPSQGSAGAPAASQGGAPGAPAPQQQPGGAATPPPMPPGPSPIDPNLQAMLALPSWEAIMSGMKDSGLRQFKIDVETDSTIQGSIQTDMQALSQVMTGVGQTLQIVTPLVQMKVLPLDAAKEMIMAVIRRAKLGIAVEDAFDKLQQPPPPPPAPPPPENHDVEVANIHAQASVDKENVRAQTIQAIADAKHEMQGQIEAAKQQGADQRHMIETRMDMLLETNKAQLDAAVQVITAQISATKAPSAVTPIAEAEFQSQVIPTQAAPFRTQLGLSPSPQEAEQHLPPVASAPGAPTQPVGIAGMPAPQAPPGEADPNAAVDPTVATPNAPDPGPSIADTHALLAQVAQHLMKPKRVVRDENGKIVGVE